MMKLRAIGNIGRTAELKISAKGSSYSKFSVGVKIKNQPNTVWLNCIIFGEMADKWTQDLLKGVKVFVEGEPEFKTYVSKTGETKIDLSLKVNELSFVERDDRPQQQTQRAQTSEQIRTQAMSSFFGNMAQTLKDEDIPF